jgi:hypothetical protein
MEMFMMPALAVSWILLQAASQDAETFRRAVAELGNERVEVRDKASTALQNLPFRFAEELKTLRKAEADSEKQQRLDTVIRHLARKEGESLFGEGKLKPALLKFAEAEGASDLQAEVDRRTKSARAFLEKCFEQPPGKQILFPPQEMQELRQKHGKWAVAPLIEFLGTRETYGAYRFIKDGLDFDVVPVLCAAVKEPDGLATNPLCNMLGALGGNPLTVKTLRSLMEDTGRSESTRKAAEAALREMGVIRGGK